MEQDVNSQGQGHAVVHALAALRPELARRFSVKRIGVFGSCARGEAGPQSDVDIIVDLAEPTFDHYMDLKFFLEETLQRRVDLVLADTVKPRLRPIIEREAVYA
ncbi:MAG: nucleotidyltransferase family protein [Desulfarculus sp.]|nr:nucleotidyltransferase family protein [Desulfarculus sp.]